MNYSILIIFLFFVQVSTCAVEVDYNLEFGLVLHDEYGTPVGFEETTYIPINKLGKNSLYGLIISKESEENFTIGSVHILPNNPSNTQKIMGKTMVINGKGAVFMKTQRDDMPGDYAMELYINGVLYKTIKYHLLSEI
jgi:hypothetical protein